MTTDTTTPTPAEIEPSPLDVAVDQARAAHDALLTRIHEIATSTDRATYWTEMADAEDRYADTRDARGDIGDFVVAEDLRAMAKRSRELAAEAAAVTA